MSELKPCPFCGGRAERIEVHEDDDFENRGGAAIECQQCLASSHVEFGRMENLVSSWNTRATPSADTLAGLVRFGWNSEDQIVDPMEDGEYALHSEAAKIIDAKDAEINLYLSVHRWNVDDNGNGILYVCRHEHDKSELCEWDKFVPYERAEAAEAKNKELEDAWLNAEGKISDLEAELEAKDGVIALKDTGLKIAMTKIAALEAKLAQYEAQEPVGCASVYIYKGRRNLDLNELGNDAAGELPIGDHKLYASPAPAPAPAADLKAENKRLREAVENTDCPRPCSGRHDDTTVKQCISYGECACVYGSALKGESNV